MLKYAHRQSKPEANIIKRFSRIFRSNHKKYLKIGLIETTKFEKSFVIKSFRHWNQLPEDLKQISNIFCFRNCVFKELLLGKLNFPE